MPENTCPQHVVQWPGMHASCAPTLLPHSWLTPPPPPGLPMMGRAPHLGAHSATFPFSSQHLSHCPRKACFPVCIPHEAEFHEIRTYGFLAWGQMPGSGRGHWVKAMWWWGSGNIWGTTELECIEKIQHGRSCKTFI